MYEIRIYDYTEGYRDGQKANVTLRFDADSSSDALLVQVALEYGYTQEFNIVLFRVNGVETREHLYSAWGKRYAHDK